MAAKGGSEHPGPEIPDNWLLEDVYPNAQEIFAAYPPPELSDNRVIVALDTNALLLPYRMNPGNLEALGKVYKSLSEAKRLVVPARAVREFAKHRDRKLADMIHALNEQRRRFPDQLPALVQGMDGFTEVVECLKDLKGIREKYDKALLKIIAAMKEWRGNDPVAKLYASVFSGDAIVDLPVGDGAKREELLKDARRRTANRIPPGFQDAGKEDEGIGDYLIWKSLLELGKLRKQDLAFVTGEQKNDWFVRSGGEHVYPRFELVDEYRRASEGRSLRLLSLPQLLDALDAPTSVVDDVKTAEAQSLAAAEAASRQDFRSLFNFIKLNDKMLVVPKSKPQAGTSPESVAQVLRWLNTDQRQFDQGPALARAIAEKISEDAGEAEEPNQELDSDDAQEQ